MDFIVHLDGPNKHLTPQLWDEVPVELQRMYVRNLLALILPYHMTKLMATSDGSGPR